MKTAIITAIAALGFASAAAADGSYAKDTIMTRNVPAESVFAPRDSALSDNGYVSVTVGEKLAVEAGDLLNPREKAIAEDGVATAYTFGGSFADTVNGAYSYR